MYAQRDLGALGRIRVLTSTFSSAWVLPGSWALKGSSVPDSVL